MKYMVVHIVLGTPSAKIMYFSVKSGDLNKKKCFFFFSLPEMVISDQMFHFI